MKTILFFVTLFFLLSTSGMAQEKKCYCNPVPGYFKEAGTTKFWEGEESRTVPIGYELWVKMKPAHIRNTLEKGGCRLRAGEKYIIKNGKIIRVDKCGNPVVASKLFKIDDDGINSENGVNVTINNYIDDDSDLKDARENLQENPFNQTGNDDFIVISEDYGKINVPDLENNLRVKKKKWFGRNWWIVPVGLAVGYALYDGFTQGGLFDFSSGNKTIIKIIDSDGDGIPDDEDNDPGHNGNARSQGNRFERPLVNIALDRNYQVQMRPTVSFPIFGGGR